MDKILNKLHDLHDLILEENITPEYCEYLDEIEELILKSGWKNTDTALPETDGKYWCVVADEKDSSNYQCELEYTKKTGFKNIYSWVLAWRELPRYTNASFKQAART